MCSFPAINSRQEKKVNISKTKITNTELKNVNKMKSFVEPSPAKCISNSKLKRKKNDEIDGSSSPPKISKMVNAMKINNTESDTKNVKNLLNSKTLNKKPVSKMETASRQRKNSQSVSGNLHKNINPESKKMCPIVKKTDESIVSYRTQKVQSTKTSSKMDKESQNLSQRKKSNSKMKSVSKKENTLTCIKTEKPSGRPSAVATDAGTNDPLALLMMMEGSCSNSNNIAGQSKHYPRHSTPILSKLSKQSSNSSQEKSEKRPCPPMKSKKTVTNNKTARPQSSRTSNSKEDSEKSTHSLSKSKKSIIVNETTNPQSSKTSKTSKGKSEKHSHPLPKSRKSGAAVEENISVPQKRNRQSISTSKPSSKNLAPPPPLTETSNPLALLMMMEGSSKVPNSQECNSHLTTEDSQADEDSFTDGNNNSGESDDSEEMSDWEDVQGE